MVCGVSPDKGGMAACGMLAAAGLLAVPLSASSQSFDDAVRANLALGIELCVRGVPDATTLKSSLGSAGYVPTVERFGNTETLHHFAAPANTAVVTVFEGQLPADCRISSSHMGVAEAVAFTGEVLEARFPGVFTYGNMENTPPVTVETLGTRWEMCTGYIGWAGQRPIYVTLGNAGQDPACIADGTTQILISM